MTHEPNQAGGPVELPKIISVDDHVVEPAHVWQTWLPEKYREKGPRVERKKWGAFRLKKGAKYEMTEDPEGEWGDAWIYEDKVIYVQKKFVAIPKAASTHNVIPHNFGRTIPPPQCRSSQRRRLGHRLYLICCDLFST